MLEFRHHIFELVCYISEMVIVYQKVYDMY